MTFPRPSVRWLLASVAALSVVLLLAAMRQHRKEAKERANAEQAAAAGALVKARALGFRFRRLGQRTGPDGAAAPPAALVQEKLSRFCDTRLALAQAIAASKRFNLLPQVEEFFAAARAGNWEETQRLFADLDAFNPEAEPDASSWRVIRQSLTETFGVAEAAHTWPADRLLQYGETLLGGLRPGTVYVGGTDPGRFIPTLLSATASADAPMVLTQNALADGSYLEYVRFAYPDRMTWIEPAESQQCFQDYLADAQTRLEHDRDLPNEPAQLRRGEEVRETDGRIQVSGSVAVMSINEKLLAKLMDKNPDLPFALEESFSLPSTYEGAVPSGALLELRATEAGSKLTTPQVAKALEFWRAAQRDLNSEPADSEVRKAWAKMAVAQANLLAGQGFTSEAEQGYRLACEMAPTLPEALFRLASLLDKSGRTAEAQRLVGLLPENPARSPR